MTESLSALKNRKSGPFADNMLLLQLPGTHKGKLPRQKILKQATLGPEVEAQRQEDTCKKRPQYGRGEGRTIPMK